MAVVCPTVTAYTVDDYTEQMGVVSAFADRVHIDMGDGNFTRKMVSVEDIWWPPHLVADIHLMYGHPLSVIEQICELNPHMIIIHAEAEDDIESVLRYIKDHGIKAGVSLLQSTDVNVVLPFMDICDHVLIFSGSLGSFGGKVDFGLLSKVTQIRSAKASTEIGWDGGISKENIWQLAMGGIDVLNVGGAIQRANRPENAFRELAGLV